MFGSFSKAQWIWYTQTPAPDTYGDFFDEFDYAGGEVLCNISCDSDYTLFVNGTFAASNQYGDFPHYKIYDTLDLTPFLKTGKNRIFVLVWHFGTPSSRYYPAQPGLIYEISSKDAVLAYSGAHTLCRQDPNYESGLKKLVTMQLGYSFRYDSTACADTPCHPALLCGKEAALFPRPIPKLTLLSPKEGKVLQADETHYLLDLGEETVGLPFLRFRSAKKQTVTVAWGEHLEDGCVRRQIDGRDFSFEYIAHEGSNDFSNYMLRLGGRYLEIFAESPMVLDACGLLPQIHEVTVLERKFQNPLDQQIYDVCVNTLQRCMMEHYVDTPWREQCFYAFDARNQILCGYRAFAGGNRDYVRACLLLASMDHREDGLLSITYPSGTDLVIPSFSLHYITAIREYLEETGDLSLGLAVYDKLCTILDTYLPQRKDGILYSFPQTTHWNFYDWSEHMEEPIGSDVSKPELMLNCLYLMALEHFRVICGKLDKAFLYDSVAETLKDAVKKAFYHPENGLFSNTPGKEDFTELGNAAAILAGLAEGEESKKVEQALLSNDLCPCSLSMKCFKYDALLQCDPANRDFVLNEIRSTYKQMLDQGATTVWETADGASAFDNAGSLCHGWSSVPIFYL